MASPSAAIDAFASAPTSTDHFRDTSDLYSVDLYRVSPADLVAHLIADGQHYFLCLCRPFHPLERIYYCLGVRS